MATPSLTDSLDMFVTYEDGRRSMRAAFLFLSFCSFLFEFV